MRTIRCLCGNTYTFNDSKIPYGTKYTAKCPRCGEERTYCLRESPMARHKVPVSLYDNDVARIICDGSLLKFTAKSGAYLFKEDTDADRRIIGISCTIQIKDGEIGNPEELIEFQEKAAGRYVSLHRYGETDG